MFIMSAETSGNQLFFWEDAFNRTKSKQSSEKCSKLDDWLLVTKFICFLYARLKTTARDKTSRRQNIRELRSIVSGEHDHTLNYKSFLFLPIQYTAEGLKQRAMRAWNGLKEWRNRIETGIWDKLENIIEMRY